MYDGIIKALRDSREKRQIKRNEATVRQFDQWDTVSNKILKKMNENLEKRELEHNEISAALEKAKANLKTAEEKRESSKNSKVSGMKEYVETLHARSKSQVFELSELQRMTQHMVNHARSELAHREAIIADNLAMKEKFISSVK